MMTPPQVCVKPKTLRRWKETTKGNSCGSVMFAPINRPFSLRSMSSSGIRGRFMGVPWWIKSWSCLRHCFMRKWMEIYPRRKRRERQGSTATSWLYLSGKQLGNWSNTILFDSCLIWAAYHYLIFWLSCCLVRSQPARTKSSLFNFAPLRKIVALFMDGINMLSR